MNIAIEPILCTIAPINDIHASMPCGLPPLLELVKLATGWVEGPTTPGFMTACITTGLVVLEQHPVLALFKFPSQDLRNQAAYTNWIAAEQNRLHLGQTFDVRPPTTRMLYDAATQAGPIAVRVLRES